MCPGQFIIPQQLLQQRAERQKIINKNDIYLVVTRCFSPSIDSIVLAKYPYPLCNKVWPPSYSRYATFSVRPLPNITTFFAWKYKLLCLFFRVFGKKFRKWLFQSLWQRGNIISFLRLCNSSSFKQFYARQSLKYNHERKEKDCFYPFYMPINQAVVVAKKKRNSIRNLGPTW